MKEYIVPVSDGLIDYDEMFVGNIREEKELIRCRDCKFFPTCLISKTMFLMGGDGYCANAEREESKNESI